MSRVEGNPESMREFARHGTEICQTAKDHVARLRARANELGNAEWTDENYRRFMERIDPVTASLDNTLEELEAEVAAVLSLADRYEELIGV
jgi:hypothetical protein